MTEPAGGARPLRVFVSVAGPDRPWAAWIAQELRRAGHAVEFDEWSWQAGTSFLANMDAALAAADRVVAVVSPDYLNPQTYGREEREAALRLAHERDGLLIPVLVAETRLPPLLGRLSHVDLTGLGEHHARLRLLAAVNGRRPPDLAERMPFPGPARSDPGAPAVFPGGATRGALSVVHLGDPRRGRDGEAAADAVVAELVERAGRLGVSPDLVVVTGDLTEHALPREFDAALLLLRTLAAELGLSRRRIAVVPGDRDVNHLACEAHFLAAAAREQEPVFPYFPKWEQFRRLLAEFYGEDGGDESGPGFVAGQEWSLFAMDELRVVVAGLNSTMAITHRPQDRVGQLGAEQRRWFTRRLGRYGRLDWLRIAAVHHCPCPPAGGDQRLADAAELGSELGGQLHLVLHGGAGHERPAEGWPDPPVLPAPAGGPGYQLLRLDAEGIVRYGDDPAAPERIRPGWTGAGAALLDSPVGAAAAAGGDPAEAEDPAGAVPWQDTFLARVQEAASLRNPDARVLVVDGAAGVPAYLRVSMVRPGQLVEQRPVGASEHGIDAAAVAEFVTRVHSRYAAGDAYLVSELVYGGPRADEALVRDALRRGVRLVSLVEYQGLLDLRGYVNRQTRRLAESSRYPPARYVPQRFRRLDGTDNGSHDGLLDRVLEWLADDVGLFLLLLGDSGSGKTFLLRELARQLSERQPQVVPLLVELSALEKVHSVDELVAAHLARHGQQSLDLRAFRYMLRTGRIALLLDGYDELVQRVTYDRAAEHLRTLVASAEGQAKIVVTGRSQHFSSDEQAHTALTSGVVLPPNRRLVRIVDFTAEQVRDFVLRAFDGERDRADARLALIHEVADLDRLARNPRMLAFMVGLNEDRLRAVSHRPDAAGWLLYQQFVDAWLTGEEDRADLPGGAPTLTAEDRLRAATAVAERLWVSGRGGLDLAELTEVAGEVLAALPGRGLDVDEITHLIGSGTVLRRGTDGLFSFIHSSVGEYLVARAAGARLRAGKDISTLLAAREMAPLMVTFLRNAVTDARLVRWARQMLADPGVGQLVQTNAMAVLRHVRGTLRGGDLSGRDLRRTDLKGVDLAGADLSRSDLRDTRLADADLSGAVLRGTRLAGARLDQVLLTGADLSGADLSGAVLTGVSLTGAELTGSRWQRAAILGGRLDADQLDSDELAAAVLPGRDGTEAMFAPSGRPRAIAVRAGGDLAAVAIGQAVALLDTRSGSMVRVLTGHRGAVLAVAFSPDGDTVVSGGADQQVRRWDVLTGRLAGAPLGHRGTVTGLAFDLDGAVLASAAADGTVRLWHGRTGAAGAVLEGHHGAVTAVAVSPTGGIVASAGQDHRVRLWQAGTGVPGAVLAGHRGPVLAVAISPDGATLASAGSSGAIRVWDVVTGQPRAILGGHTGAVHALAFDPGTGLLVSGGEDGAVHIWDLARGRAVAAMAGHTGDVRGVAGFHGPGVASVADDLTVRLWDLDGYRLRMAVSTRRPVVNAVAFGPDGDQLASGGSDGIRIWDVHRGESRPLHGRGLGAVRAIAYHPGGRQLAAGGADGVRIWDLAGGGSRGVEESRLAGLRTVAFSPDGRQLAGGGADGVRIWDVAGGGSRTVGPGRIGGVRGVAFSPDGRQLAVGGADGVRIWDVAGGGSHRMDDGRVGGVRGVAFSPDGQLLAVGGADGARIWDVSRGESRRLDPGRVGGVRGVAFSPDGALVAVGGTDGIIRLMRLAPSQEVRTLVCLDEGGWAAVSPDGAYKVASDSAAAFWWVSKLCRFTAGELDPYVPHIRRLPVGAPFPPGSAS
jgi:WD40 repeat protein